MDFKNVLAQNGLDEKEITVYTTLLEIGEASVFSIAKRAGLKRPNTYVVLGALETRGLVSRIERKKKIFFIAQHPKKLIHDTEIRLKELKDVMPELESIMGRSDGRPRILLYEGVSALDRAYDDFFLKKGEVLFMSNVALAQSALARTFQKWDYVSHSSDFSLRELIDDTSHSLEYAKKVEGPNRQTRFIPKQFLPFATDIGICGATVVISSIQKEYFAVKIESEGIANSFRALFEAMWQISKVPDTSNGAF